METKEVKQVSEKLNKFSYIAKDEDFIIVTEWANKEGWDIAINDKIFSLHDTELDAINYLTKVLLYEK